MVKITDSGFTHRSPITIEQLQHRITQAVSIGEKIETRNSLAWQLRIREPDRARRLSSDALELATSIGDENAIAASLITLAFLDAEAGDMDVSFSRALNALTYLEDQLPSIILVDAWYTLGWAYYYSGNYPAALEFGLKSLNQARDLDHREREAWCLDLVACSYRDVTQSLRMHESAFAMFKDMGHMEGQCRILNNWACMLVEAKDFTKAMELAQTSYQLAKLYGLKGDEVNVMATMGEILAGMGDYQQAQVKLIDATRLFDKYGRDISSIYVLVDLGQVYLKQNDLDHAEQELLKALETSARMELKNEQARCHQYLSEIFERRGKYDQALEHYKKFQGLRESMSGEGALNELAALRVSHQIETAQRDAEIQRLQKEKLQNELNEHKRIHAILEELATRDPLTNLFNRRHFMSLAEREWKRAVRYYHPLCALMLDVDQFKQINDEHGHAVGDKALTAFANVLRSSLRSTEIAGRYGGDEFVVLLPETEPENGLVVARRICKSITEYTINSDSGSIELTPSIGVACASTETTKSLSELLNHADKAMYIAKKAGKGQVYLYSEETKE